MHNYLAGKNVPNHKMFNPISSQTCWDFGGQAQTYDDNGNLTSDGTRTFSYDYANRLVRIVTATQTTTYKYDVFGRRIEKSVDGAITHYYYAGNRVIEDRDGADAVSATYVFGSGIDELLTMDRGGQTYYFHTNAQGSITEITDSTGAIVERYEYDAYGAITIFTAPGVDGIWQTAADVVSAVSAIGNRYTFTGREFESESGLYYYRDVLTTWHDENDMEDVATFVVENARANGLSRIIAVMNDSIKPGIILKKHIVSALLSMP